MKYKIEATIPTTQYGNIRPTFEIENDGDEDTAIVKMTELWAKYGEKPLKVATGQIEGFKSLVELHTFTEESILWDEANHKYYSMGMKPLVSGSGYADSVSPKFDKAMLLPKTAKAWGVKEEELDELWNLGGRVSTEYGSAIHTALDIWHKYSLVGEAIKEKKGLDENYVLPKNKHIRDIVMMFNKEFGAKAETEVLISDVNNLMAGRIDRLEILDYDKKVCRVGDYKTNNDLDDKKMLKYQHQMSFYAHILQNKGWTVEGLDIFHYDGEKWVKTVLEVLELKK